MIDFRYFPTDTNETYLIDKLMGLKLHEAERDKIFISSKHYSFSPSRFRYLRLGKIGHLIADVMGGNKSKYQGEDNNCSRARRLICIKVVDSDE